MKRRIPLAQAHALAEDFITAIYPFCERAEVAGSVRRGQAELGDIEIVAQPLTRPVMGLFGPMGETDALLDFPWHTWGRLVKNGPRYKQIFTPQEHILSSAKVSSFIYRINRFIILIRCLRYLIFT